MIGPDRSNAGGLVDVPAIALAHDLTGKVQDIVTHPRSVLTELLADGTGTPAYVAFSNTVIYFPLAYLLPAVAIAAARQAGLAPLAWFYLGRLTNAAAALLVSAAAILLFEDAAIYAFVVCLIPRVLFEEASLSADALVIPFALLFWALLAGFAAQAVAAWYVLPAFFLAMLYVCVGKFAYIPLAVLPPLVAVMERRRAPSVVALAAASALALACWVFWSLAVQDKVFTIGQHVGAVDAHLQLQAVLRDPMPFLHALRASLRASELHLFLGMDSPTAGRLHDVILPVPVLTLSLSTLAAAAVLRRPGPVLRVPARAATGLAVLTCVAAIYFLLYLQFTPVGSWQVDGMQGRYFIPLLGSVPILLARVPRLGRWRPPCDAALLGCSVFASVSTVVMVWRSYWAS